MGMGSLGAPGAKAVGRQPVENRCGDEQRKQDSKDINQSEMSETVVISYNGNAMIVVKEHIERPGSMC
jgi:hypothetical protein